MDTSSWIHTWSQAFFYRFVPCLFFEVMSIRRAWPQKMDMRQSDTKTLAIEYEFGFRVSPGWGKFHQNILQSRLKNKNLATQSGIGLTVVGFSQIVALKRHAPLLFSTPILLSDQGTLWDRRKWSLVISIAFFKYWICRCAHTCVVKSCRKSSNVSIYKNKKHCETNI